MNTDNGDPRNQVDEHGHLVISTSQARAEDFEQRAEVAMARAVSERSNGRR